MWRVSLVGFLNGVDSVDYPGTWKLHWTSLVEKETNLVGLAVWLLIGLEASLPLAGTKEIPCIPGT